MEGRGGGPRGGECGERGGKGGGVGRRSLQLGMELKKWFVARGPA